MGRGRSPRRPWPTAGLIAEASAAARMAILLLLLLLLLTILRRPRPRPPLDGSDRPPRRPTEATTTAAGSRANGNGGRTSAPPPPLPANANRRRPPPAAAMAGSCPTILPPTAIARRPTDTTTPTWTWPMTMPVPTPLPPTSRMSRPLRRRQKKPNRNQLSKRSSPPTWPRNLASTSPIATPCTRPPSARSDAERGRRPTTSSITMGTRSPTSTGSPCRNSRLGSTSRISPLWRLSPPRR
mmetsp:Transcript_31771/g.93247  ORF Transcript_31771/g.93247 Transcript_31771/m.93247 type:complete len:240 (+) Transcript_31771:1337-2056(+)